MSEGATAAADAPRDTHEFDAFVRRHLGVLHAALSRSAPTHADLEDALQEALLRAYAKRGSFASERHLVNWLLVVARGLLVDQRRSFHGKRVTTDATVADHLAGVAPDPADLVTDQATGEAAVRAVAALPAGHRELLWEHAIEGRSYAEIARSSDRPLATVRSIAHRARGAAARHFLREHGPLGVGIAVAARVRGRLGRVPWHQVPSDAGTAVAVALTLVLGAGAVGYGSGDEAATQVTLAPARAAGTPAASPKPEIETNGVAAGRGGAAGTTPVTSAPSATPTDPGPPTVAPGPAAANWNGTADSRCRFRTLDAPAPTNPTAVSEYWCTVQIRSTECTTVGQGARPVEPCTIRATATAHGTANTVLRDSDRTMHRCQYNDTSAVVITYAIDGGPPIGIPSSLSVLVEATLRGTVRIHGGRSLELNAKFAFPCAERQSVQIVGGTVALVG